MNQIWRWGNVNSIYLPWLLCDFNQRSLGNLTQCPAPRESSRNVTKRKTYGCARSLLRSRQDTLCGLKKRVLDWGIFWHSRWYHEKPDSPTLGSTSPSQSSGCPHTGQEQPVQWDSRASPSDSLPSLLDLHLPKFSISGTYNLEEILPHIGLTGLFNSEADYSGITGQLNRTISRVRWCMWMCVLAGRGRVCSPLT